MLPAVSLLLQIFEDGTVRMRTNDAGSVGLPVGLPDGLNSGLFSVGVTLTYAFAGLPVRPTVTSISTSSARSGGTALSVGLTSAQLAHSATPTSATTTRIEGIAIGDFFA